MGAGVLAAALLQLGQARKGENVAETAEVVPHRLDLRQLLLVLDQNADRLRVTDHVGGVGRPSCSRRPGRRSPRQAEREVEQAPLEASSMPRIENASPFFTPRASSPFARASTRSGCLWPGDLLPARRRARPDRRARRRSWPTASRQRAAIVFSATCRRVLSGRESGPCLEFEVPHAHDLERIDQLQPGHDSRRARAGDEAVGARLGHLVPAAARRVQDADQEPQLVPGARARGRDRTRSCAAGRSRRASS